MSSSHTGGARTELGPSVRTPDRRYSTRRHRLTILSDHYKEISMGVTRMIGILCAVVMLGLTRTDAQERIVLTVAESNPEYRMANFVMVPDDPGTTVDEGQIFLDLRGSNGESVACRYGSGSNPTGTFLINGLNKANLSTAYAGNATTGSLKQRIFHRLVVMAESTAVCGKTLTGTLQGAVP
jgi:hypothetical protein